MMSDPRLLAACAAGFASAAAALWAFRGLPMGTALFWLSSFPIFAAGLGFGSGAAVGAAALAATLLALVGSLVAAAAFLALFGAPAALLLVVGLRSAPGGGAAFRPGWPLALLGLWPVAVLGAGTALLGGGEALQTAMRLALETTMGRAGFAVPEPLLGQLVRVKAAVIGLLSALAMLFNGFAARRVLLRSGIAVPPLPDPASVRLPAWYPLLAGLAAGLFLAAPAGADAVPLSALAMLFNGFAARRVLLRWGIAVPPLPDPASVRLPAWYPLLAGLAAGLFLAAPAGADAVPLSALLLLLVPLGLLGVAGVHARAKGRPARVPMLALFYLLLALFLQVMGPAMVGLGLYDQFRRRAPSAPPSV